MSGAVEPRLYYMPRTRSSRVLWLLEEIGGPYRPVQIPGAQRRSEEHLERHPLGRVPALELGDGAAICAIGRSEPGCGVDPSGEIGRAGACLSMGAVRDDRARRSAVSLARRARRRRDGICGAGSIRPGCHRARGCTRRASVAPRRSVHCRRCDLRECACGCALAGAVGRLAPGCADMWSAVRRAPRTSRRPPSGIDHARERHSR